MKLKNHILIFLLLIPVVQSCILVPKEYRTYIEPTLISINKNLTFNEGPTWDPAFVNSEYYSSMIVTLDPYKIGKYELSNEEYEKFVIDGGYDDSTYWSEDGWEYKKTGNWILPLYWDEESYWQADSFSNLKDTPVHGISYYEAEAYCNWLSEKTNKNYHIPTSQQWVRAAKGPDPGNKYPWGNEFNESYAHYIIWIDTLLTFVGDHPEGKSYDGCYQMVGNAYEMTLVEDEKTYYSLYSKDSGLCSSVECMKINMITISCNPVIPILREFGIGFRICRSDN